MIGTRMPAMMYKQPIFTGDSYQHGFQYSYFLDEEELSELLYLEAKTSFYFLLFDICKSDEFSQRFYVKQWGNEKIFEEKFQAGESLESDTKIEPSEDFIWLGGFDRRTRNTNSYYSMQGAIADAKFFRSGCLSMDQVKEIAASYEVCHPSCPNSCFGPRIEHCNIVAVEQF